MSGEEKPLGTDVAQNGHSETNGAKDAKDVIESNGADTATDQTDVSMEDVPADDDNSKAEPEALDETKDDASDESPEEPEPSAKRRKVEGDESTQTDKSSKTTEPQDSETKDDVVDTKSETKPNTPAKSDKRRDSSKKDGKIDSFFISTTPSKATSKDKSASAAKSSAATPKAATPKSGSSKTGTPKTGTPKAGTPKAGTPKAGTPKIGGTPLKLKLKAKPTLPPLEEDSEDKPDTVQTTELDEDSPENHPDVAFCVMFRTRFTDLFDGWCPPLSAQEFESGIQLEEGFSHAVESYLVRVMSLMMNRKKPVEVGKYSNALETWSLMPLTQGSVSQIDALSIPCGWNRKLASRDVVAMDWRGRLQLLKMATLSALSLSEAIKKLIADKRDVVGRKVMSELQFLPLGEDRNRDTYWLVDGSGDINWDEKGKLLPSTEGAFDTSFRVYRQTNPYKSVVSWLPVASSPEEISTLIEELPTETKGSDGVKKLLDDLHNNLAAKLDALIPRMIAAQHRVYEAEQKVIAQQQRKAAATRAMELQKSKVGSNRGRTRGKRVDYKQLAQNGAESDEEFQVEREQREEDALAQGHRRTGRTGRTRASTYTEPSMDYDEFEETPSPEPEAEKPDTPRNAEGKRIRYVEQQHTGRNGKGWVIVTEEVIE